MATITTNPGLTEEPSFTSSSVPAWPRGEAPGGMAADAPADSSTQTSSDPFQKPSQLDALQALLAFSSLHEQVRRRKALATRHTAFDGGAPAQEFEASERFVLDEILQLVAERAIAITGADGLAIALAENNEIVLRAAAGSVRPDIGARIDRESAFSGASFREALIVMCDDTETDARVNLQACRKLGARSMIAVPLCGRRRVIGLLEAFSSWPFGFNDSDVRNLSLLAELVVGALRPEDEDRFADSAQVAQKELEPDVRPITASGPEVPIQVVSEAAPALANPIAAAPVDESTDAPVPAAAVDPAVAPAATPGASEAPIVPSETKQQEPVKAATAVLEAPAPEAGKTAETEQPVAVVGSEPALTFGQAEPEKKQSLRMVWLLLGTVVVAAFAAGVVWKLKMAQVGGAMVTTEPSTSKPAAPATDSTQPPTPPTANPAAAVNTKPDTMTDVSSQTAPATLQELSKFPRVTGVRHWASADSSTVVLDLEDQVQYEAHRLLNPDRIYFDLHDTQLAPELSGKSIEVGDPLLTRIRVAQPVAGMTRIVLETKSDTKFSVSLEPNPYRLVVEVRKIGTTAKGEINLFPNAGAEKSAMAIVIPPPTKEDLQLRARAPKMRIVVDAGHGGWDLGTVGKRGLLEKDLVLEISQRLGKLLESRLRSEVIYTRPDDNYITLDDRASIANQAQADLFVSVHANYSDLPSARGVETYFTNSFSAPGSKEAGSGPIETRSSAATLKNVSAPELSPAELRDRVEQSRRLAASVQRALYGTLSVQNPGLRDRGIKEAGFVVLTESAMPGILAEVSFVSSPTDEQRLRSDGYREQIAEALYRGIARYAASSKGVKMASVK